MIKGVKLPNLWKSVESEFRRNFSKICSLQVMTLNPVCENVETAQGVPLTVTGVAQVKIMKNADLLQTASEQFLGKKEHEIKSTVLQTLEGHLRAILGKFIEKPYKFLADVAKSHTLRTPGLQCWGYLG